MTIHKLILLLAFFVFMPLTAHAACSSPAGAEGKIIYNTGHNMLQFCNGTDWVAMTGSSLTAGTLPSCSDHEILKSTGSGWACAAAGCPDGYTESGSKCYKFHSPHQNYAGAVSTCAGEGAILAFPSNVSENSSLLAISGGDTIWIGVNDIVSEGTWMNESGGSQSYFNWGGGEPNNASNEDCALIASSGAWNDGQCVPWTESFVCETSL